MQWLKLLAWKVGDRVLESRSGTNCQRKKMFLLRSLIEIQYCRFLILCLEGSVISFISPSFGGSLSLHVHKGPSKNICITSVQRRPNVLDVGPILYKFYMNVLCFLGLPKTPFITFSFHLLRASYFLIYESIEFRSFPLILSVWQRQHVSDYKRMVPCRNQSD